MKNFEHSGLWWLPKNADNKVSGTIKFDPVEGAILELIGSLNIGDFTTIILGITPCGEKVTLYECFVTKSTYSPKGFSTSIFAVNVIFLGHHFEKKEDILFNSLSISYSYLDEWSGITGFKIKEEVELENPLSKFDVSYSLPSKAITKLDNFDISFDNDFKYDFAIRGNFIKEISLKQTVFLKIEPQLQLHFNHYQRDICSHLQNFLSLAIGKAIYPLIIKGNTLVCQNKLSDEKILYGDIFIYYPMNFFPNPSEKISTADILFSLDDISDNFEKYLKNWFAKSATVGLAYRLYVGTLYNPTMFLDHEFLSLAQAIESYHRRTNNGKYLLNCDYELIYDNLMDAVPQLYPDFRDSLKERLKYLNEFSLRKRLKEILEKCGDIKNLLISNNEKFIEDVINTRNYLTHYDKNLELKAKKSEELYRLVQIMKFILEICFLIDLEMPADTIKVLTERRLRYRSIPKW